MSDFGIKITRPGSDITSTDLRDYVIHSGYKSLKAKERVTDSMTLTAGNTSLTKNIAHGLGYAPMFFVSAEMNSGKWYNLNAVQSITIDSSPSYAYLISARTDTTNLVISLTSGTTFGTDQTYNLVYYIVIDEIL